MAGETPDDAPGAPDIAVEEGRPKTQEPPKYAVILHNDDYTTMEFVIEVLQKYFHKGQDEAMQITLRVHHQGHGLAGIFDFEIAETKVSQVGEYAQTHGFPLKCTAEPV